ncbi:unnamed protein product [Paramecium sonneborni]|uniref:Uncharacterized protein n=1 Tax=Paramecium sonneborni TaxID=65129 RepID=A0A8S1MRX5_9CILI|nr:unnamed protein product [Paramecium sonneborni]
MEESSKIILGWIVISLVILCVSCEIITLLFEICKLLYEKILDLLKLLLNKEQINKNIQTRNDIQEVIEPKILKENKLSFMKHGQLHQFIK